MLHDVQKLAKSGVSNFCCNNIENFTNVTYMSSSFWLLGVESRDFSQACKPKQIHKMTTIFTQNNNLRPS